MRHLRYTMNSPRAIAQAAAASTAANTLLAFALGFASFVLFSQILRAYLD